MPASKAQQRATNKYIAKAYDRINLTVSKGKRDIIQAHAEARSESVNGFINRAIDQTMEQDSGGEKVAFHDHSTAGPQEAAPTAGGALPLPPAVLEDIRRMAEAEGENVADFVSRAASAYALRDDAETAQEAQDGLSGAGVVSLPSETLETAQRAAETVGEALPNFVARAIATQAKRDQSSLRLGINPATGGKLREE